MRLIVPFPGTAGARRDEAAAGDGDGRELGREIQRPLVGYATQRPAVPQEAAPRRAQRAAADLAAAIELDRPSRDRKSSPEREDAA